MDVRSSVFGVVEENCVFSLSRTVGIVADVGKVAGQTDEAGATVDRGIAVRVDRLLGGVVPVTRVKVYKPA